jgi:hypothetical protein
MLNETPYDKNELPDEVKPKALTIEQQALYNLVQLAISAVNGYAEILGRKIND